ncbi:CDP-archaeol synthase [Candidatus Nomurabacteria bacterium]|jgi:CDP-2,3-bis-(O-geranylgeranyl)-sn-glycerol synthase|nr:MAG: CDP-archaeol synthase [Candidatus Nomurabacteria bacterium]
MINLSHIIYLILLLLPAGIANMTPVFLQKLPYARPIDNRKTYKGRRITGDNKTWRGLLGGIILGTLAASIEGMFFAFPATPLLWGLTISTGALIGDIIESMIKRRLGKQPGTAWHPFDEIDWLLGALIFGSFLYAFDVMSWLLVITIGAILHTLINYLRKRLLYYFSA